MSTLTARLDQWLEEDIRSFSNTLGEGPSATLRRVITEWWSLEHFPLLEFRDGVTGRRAGLRGGPDVWEVILVANSYEGDREAKLKALEEHFGGFISRTALEQAFAPAHHSRENPCHQPPQPLLLRAQPHWASSARSAQPI